MSNFIEPRLGTVSGPTHQEVCAQARIACKADNCWYSMRWFCSIRTIALAACIARTLAGQGCRLISGPVLTQRVRHFVATEERRLSALVRLGRENGLCFGIETVTDNFNEKITLRLTDTDAQNAINAILGSPREYEISVLHNVILIRDKRVRPPEYLALRLPRFRIPRSTLVWADLNLWMSVELYLDPSRKGFAGDSPPGDATDQVGPFDITGQKIRSLLCRVVGNSKGPTWIVSSSIRPAIAPASINRLWTLVLYRNPQ